MVVGTLGPLPGEGQGVEGHGASAVPSLTWRGCQVHTGGRIQGQAAVGARLGHRMLNRGTYWSGLGAQPAPIGHCCHQAEGQGSGFGGWGPSALGAAESRWRGDAGLSSCWQKAAAPPPGGAWPVGWLCSPALVTTSCSHPLRSMAHHERTRDQDDHGENGPGREIRVTAVMPAQTGEYPFPPGRQQRTSEGNGLTLQDLRPLSLTRLCSREAPRVFP